MPSKKLPAFQFYPGDWLKDPSLRRCSLPARAVWIDIICMMHEMPRRGVLRADGGDPLSKEDLCYMIQGCTPCLIDELINKKVLRIADRSGVMYSKRLLRDEVVRHKKAINGKSGGRPASKQSAKNNQRGTEQETKEEPKGNLSGNLNGGSSSSVSSSASAEYLNTHTHRPMLQADIPRLTQEQQDFVLKAAETLHSTWEAGRAGNVSRTRERLFRAICEHGYDCVQEMLDNVDGWNAYIKAADYTQNLDTWIMGGDWSKPAPEISQKKSKKGYAGPSDFAKSLMEQEKTQNNR